MNSLLLDDQGKLDLARLNKGVFLLRFNSDITKIKISYIPDDDDDTEQIIVDIDQGTASNPAEYLACLVSEVDNGSDPKVAVMSCF